VAESELQGSEPEKVSRMSDLLLEWMSFRRDGRLDSLPANHLPASPHRVVGSLSELGHIEITGKASWRIAPPVLACLPEQPDAAPSAVLCGARTPRLVRRLEMACHSAEAQMGRDENAGWPSVIRVSAPSYGLLADIGARVGIIFQYNAAYTLLSCVPSVREWPRQPCQMVGGRVETVRRFSGSSAKWVPSSLSEARAASKGFFRIKRDWDWVNIFKSSQTDCAYIDDRAGRMLAAAKRRHVLWDSTSHTFSLPVYLFPPPLIARALVLCTGSLPVFDRASGRISFAGVNPAMLRLTLAISGLRLA
jgi:hypothetical protein